MKRFFLIGIILLLFQVMFYACFVVKKQNKAEQFYSHFLPPGSVDLKDSLFCDAYEIANIDWREYLFWLEQIYGNKSQEYIEALPDTLVWQEIDTSLSVLVHMYLRHPTFANYPVVGISQEQAKKYSKWRSDRVFEIILVQNNIIEWDPNQNDTSFFTIDNYFEGKYKNYKPDSNFLFYPNYRLPKYQEIIDFTAINDSLIEKAKKIKNKYEYPNYLLKLDSNNTIPLKSAYMNESYKKVSVVYNLKDNVSEWLIEDGTCFGGNWNNKKIGIDTFKAIKPSAFIGFRNVCEWKKWEPHSVTRNIH